MSHDPKEMEAKGGKKLNGKPLTPLDRLIQGVQAEGRELGRHDDPARDKYPALWQWLTQSEAGRDYVKTPAKLTIVAGPEGFLASITDADLAVSMDCPSATMEGIYGALEASLTGGAPAIRSWGKKTASLRKRKPK